MGLSIKYACRIFCHIGAVDKERGVQEGAANPARFKIVILSLKRHGTVTLADRNLWQAVDLDIYIILGKVGRGNEKKLDRTYNEGGRADERNYEGKNGWQEGTRQEAYGCD